MSEPLVTLFGNQARVRLLRMFLFNPSLSLSVNEILKRAKLSRLSGRTELNQLERGGIIRKKMVYEAIVGKKKQRRVVGYGLNSSLDILPALQTFLFATAPIDGKNLLKHLRSVGKIQVLVSAGVFLNEFERRLDVLVAVEKLIPAKIETAIRNLEAELGLDIKYTAFETKDLLYRISMHDKLTRDVFDYPHQLLIDKISIKQELHR